QMSQSAVGQVCHGQRTAGLQTSSHSTSQQDLVSVAGATNVTQTFSPHLVQPAAGDESQSASAECETSTSGASSAAMGSARMKWQCLILASLPGVVTRGRPCDRRQCEHTSSLSSTAAS